MATEARETLANTWPLATKGGALVTCRLPLFALLSVLLCVLSSVHALAQPFPSKTVRIVVPYAVGGSTDIIARALAVGLSSLWNQPVVVENIGGAGSIIGAERVATAPPDGHTLMLTIDPTVVGNRFLYKKLPYDPDKSFIPVTMVAQSGQLVIVNPSVPVSTFRDLVEAARRAPGKFAYASTGMGSSPHLLFETIAKREGVQFLHVTYKGVAHSITAVIAGEVQLSGASPVAVGGMIKAGKIRALAIGGARRSKLFPEIPTLAEAGYPDTGMALWFGLFAPGGASEQLVERIYQDTTATIRRPEFAEKYLNPHGLDLVANTPSEFAAAIRANTAVTAEMVKAANIKPE